MMRRPSVQEVIQQLDATDANDPEWAHSQADQILLAHVAQPVRDAYARLEERAKWWAAA